MKDDLNFLINFIKEVESHPCIYDCRNIDYVNKRATDMAWTEIANKLNESASECKSKWRSTRSSYIRSLHPTKDGPKKEYYLAPYLTFLNPFIRFRQEDDISNVSSPNQTIEVCYVNDSVNSNMKIEPGLDEEDVDEEQESDNSIGLTIPQPSSNSSRNGSVHRKKIAKLKRHSKKNYNMYEADNNCGVENVTIDKTDSEPNNKEDSYEFYVKSLLPHLRSMTERQYFAFQRGVIDLIENIKYSETSQT